MDKETILSIIEKYNSLKEWICYLLKTFFRTDKDVEELDIAFDGKLVRVGWVECFHGEREDEVIEFPIEYLWMSESDIRQAIETAKAKLEQELLIKAKAERIDMLTQQIRRAETEAKRITVMKQDLEKLKSNG